MAITLLDIAIANGTDAVVGLIEEAIKVHPEMLMGTARTIKGMNYKTLVRTGVPTGGSFRNANEGTDIKKGTYENRMVETFIFEPRWEADKAVCDRNEDGAEAYMAMEAAAVLEGAMQDACDQFYNGSNAKGFPGLLQTYDATAMAVDAGGSAAKTSVWGVRFGPQHVQWVFGNGGSFEMNDPQEETLTDSAGLKYAGYTQNMLAYPGLQVGSRFSVGRIKKLSTDSGKGLTDALIYSLLETFPEGTQPDVLLMNKRSLGQLQASRTATNATGQPAPIPESVIGSTGPIPIKLTGAITNAEV